MRASYPSHTAHTILIQWQKEMQFLKDLVLLVVSLVSSGRTFITSCSQQGAGSDTQDTGARETRGEKPNINIVHYSIVTLYWGPGNVPVFRMWEGEGENITLYEDLTR